MSDPEKAAELARLRDYRVELESGEVARGPGPGEPRYNERELARVRALIAELEAELGI
jgi:hypothetical protein